jgi:hypothetical protein
MSRAPDPQAQQGAETDADVPARGRIKSDRRRDLQDSPAWQVITHGHQIREIGRAHV